MLTRDIVSPIFNVTTTVNYNCVCQVVLYSEYATEHFFVDLLPDVFVKYPVTLESPQQQTPFLRDLSFIYGVLKKKIHTTM